VTENIIFRSSTASIQEFRSQTFDDPALPGHISHPACGEVRLTFTGLHHMLTPQPLPSRSTVTRTTIRRRGVAAILAMMFLVIFGTLAVGFYASTTISVQVARPKSNSRLVRCEMPNVIER
jgi:hypothetical protein